MKNANPWVLVGCPTYDGKAYCFDAYADSVLNLDYENYDVLLVDNSEGGEYFGRISKKLPAVRAKRYENARKTLAEARNILRHKVLEGGYDFFLSLEQDIIPPKDVISSLLAHKKDIAAGHYIVPKVINRKLGAVSTALIKEGSKLVTLPREIAESGRLVKIEACGLGCMLISRAVLGKVGFRYEEGRAAWDDMFFSKDAIAAGFEMFLDTSVKCRHLIRKSS